LYFSAFIVANGMCKNGADGNYPHEISCSHFYSCSGGKTIKRRCPGGLYFQPKGNKCDLKENVQCKNGIARSWF